MKVRAQRGEPYNEAADRVASTATTYSDALTAAEIFWVSLSGSSFPEKAKKRLMQSVGFQFPSRALLHQWGKEDSPNCPFCRERESLGHIQSRCKVLEKPPIVAHHMIWREILLQLLSHSGDEGNEHNWAIPSALSAEQHKEITVRQILHSHGLFPSDEAL